MEPWRANYLLVIEDESYNLFEKHQQKSFSSDLKTYYDNNIIPFKIRATIEKKASRGKTPREAFLRSEGPC